MKVNFTIQRNNLTDCVQGVLTTARGFRCMTIERPWLDNQKSVSCVPVGTYSYEYRVSPSNGPVLQLKNVVDRTYIQIHIGNYVRQSEGCILVGESFKLTPGKEPMVTSSEKTLKLLLESVPKRGVMVIK